MITKSHSLTLRLLTLVATMTVGAMAFAVAPSPPISLSTNLGAYTYGYTLEVTDAPAATNTAWVDNGKIYVLEGKPYTFKLTGTEHDNWYIGMKPTLDDGVTLNHDGRNGSRSGAGPNSTFIYIDKTFNTGGTHLIGQVRYYQGPNFSQASMNPEPIEVNIIKVDSLVPDSNPYEVDDEDNNPDTRLFVVDVSSTVGDVVTVTATPNPNVPEEQLPPCWSLTGGTGTNKLQRTIDQTTPSMTVLTCTCGGSSKVTTVYVAKFTFAAMSDRGNIGHAWWHFDLQPNSAIDGVIRHVSDALTVHIDRDAGFFPETQGDLNDDGFVQLGDQGHPVEASHVWNIKYTDFISGISDAEAWRVTPGMYHGDIRNCVWGVIRIGNASGLSMPGFNYQSPLWPAINGFWHPNQLADWLDSL